MKWMRVDLEDPSARPAPPRAGVNWLPIILMGLSLAAIETAAVIYLNPWDIRSHYDVPLLVLRYAFVVSVWIAFLTLAALQVRVVRQLHNKALRTALLVCILACLMPVEFFLLCSWVFFFWTSSFLTGQLMLFSLDNFAQMAFHFLQLFPVQFLSGVMGAATASVITLLVMLKSSRGSGGTAITRIAKASCLALIFAGAFSYAFIEEGVWLREKTHPLVTFISTSLPQHRMEADRSLIENLQPRSVRKTPVTKCDPMCPVIVIVLESMRHDMALQSPSPIPFMKSLIGESFFFDKAYAVSSQSSYADISIWYAQYPLRTPLLSEYTSDSEWRETSVFSVFKELGYATGYVSSQNEKWGGMIHWLKVPEVDFFYHAEDFHGQKWIDHPVRDGWVDSIRKNFDKIATAGKLEDSETVAVAQKWIAQLTDKKRFFLGMNVQNTHYSYFVPTGGQEPFQPSVMDFPTYWGVWPRDKVVHVKNRFFNAAFNLDLIIERFVDFLKSEGIWDNCYFVLMGDHGEAFYEHWHANHGGAMHDEVMRTFCLVKPPKGHPVHTVQRPVSVIDIIPGILDLMGIPQPQSFQGASPFGNPERNYVYMHGNGLIAQDGIIRWPWKLLVGRRPDELMELYNLDEDPLERVSEVNRRRDLASELLDKLNEWRLVQLTYYGETMLFKNFYPPKMH